MNEYIQSTVAMVKQHYNMKEAAATKQQIVPKELFQRKHRSRWNSSNRVWHDCLNSLIDFTFEFDHYFSFVQGRTRRANTANCLKTNYAHTSLFRDYFFNRITIIWNGIPEDIKVANTLRSFKSQLNFFLL